MPFDKQSPGAEASLWRVWVLENAAVSRVFFVSNVHTQACPDLKSILECLQEGGGYLLKELSMQEQAYMTHAVEHDSANKVSLLAEGLLRMCLQTPESSGANDPEWSISSNARLDETIPLVLSPREQSVLSMLSRGFSYREIAGLLNVSINTVQTHVKSLYRKMAVRSRGEAVFEASRLGLLTIGK